MDATKAFDRVTYSKLFRLLIDRDLPACIIRLLLNAYASNFVRVAWVMSCVNTFLLLTVCMYTDNLLVRLPKSGVGCYVGNIFVGAVANTDDIVLVAPSASAMRRLLSMMTSLQSSVSHLTQPGLQCQ